MGSDSLINTLSLLLYVKCVEVCWQAVRAAVKRGGQTSFPHLTKGNHCEKSTDRKNGMQLSLDLSSSQCVDGIGVPERGSGNAGNHVEDRTDEDEDGDTYMCGA